MIKGIDYIVVNYDNRNEVIHSDEITGEMYHFIAEAKQYPDGDTVFYRMR